MAIGKNKRLTKSKKGGKRRITDPFLKKEWYNIKAPSLFEVKTCGKTLVSKTQGTRIASDGLKGRIFEVSLADLNKDEDMSYRKIKLCAEDVQGYNVLTNFHGMDMTRDKVCGLITKWKSIIEASVEVRTTDGYLLRMFCIAFTKKMPNQVKKTCYAKAAQQRQIRKKMVDVMSEEASKCDLKELVKKLMPEVLPEDIMKQCAGIFPIQQCFIRKVKVLKKPKFDLTKLMEMHGDAATEDVGAKVDQTVVEEGVAGSGGRL
jgi:small subunit ribosomal protein S3Ae